MIREIFDEMRKILVLCLPKFNFRIPTKANGYTKEKKRENVIL